MGTTSSEDSKRELAVVNCSSVNIAEKGRVAYQVESGEHASHIPEIESLKEEGKEGQVFAHMVTQLDNGTVVVTMKRNGEKVTIPVQEYAALLQARKIQANPVPAKKPKTKTQGTDRS